MSTLNYDGIQVTHTIDADVWADYSAADNGADAGALWSQLVDATLAALQAAFPGAEIEIREEPRQSGGPGSTRVYVSDEAEERLGGRAEDEIRELADEVAGRAWMTWQESLPVAAG